LLIDEHSHFDPDSVEDTVVGVAADLGRHDSGMHSHIKGQILYAPRGCMHFALEDSICVLPPTKAVWIPPGTLHRAYMNNVVAYRSLYFDSNYYPCPTEITTIIVSDLLKALINKMSFWSVGESRNETRNCCNLFWEEFYASEKYFCHLPLPKDRRLHYLHLQLSNEQFLAPNLASLAESVALSPKTVTRIFKAETGMPYQDWRQQWRKLKAVELLCRKLQVSDVAYWLEFSSDSAFIAFFKKHTGQTPLQFIKGNVY